MIHEFPIVLLDPEWLITFHLFRAYIEAIEEYEKKLVSLEKDLRSSLQKEAERR